ncbi:HNH endonuclease [Pedobacter sp. WC2423]|uniref:HNH endonuclease n=1 Tax=Pedobacter sp. WC2423 TaxID=3234142 RepID=UPI0034652EA3
MMKIVSNFNEQTGMVDINFVVNLPEKFRKQHEDFFSIYEVTDFQPNQLQDRLLKPKHERTCRFCTKSFPEVTFKKKAHIIPELLGKSSFVSDFECDVCNLLFSTYETDLASFIGAPRSLSSKKGKNGNPTYKSAYGNLEIRHREDPETGSKKDLTSSNFEEDIEINLDDKKMTINADRPPYTPLRVFKSLAKIALTLFNEEEFAEYADLNLMLQQTDEQQNKLSGNPLCRAMIYVNPGPEFPSPLALMVRKKKSSETFPTHSMLLYFHNYIYQIFLPFCKQDLWMYDGKTNITLHSAPPMVDKAFTNKYGLPELHNVELSSAERIKNQKHTIVMSFNNILKMEGNENDVTKSEE